MITKTFTKGSDQFNGIFCSLKSSLIVNKASNQSWNGSPKDYFCTTSAHNTYPEIPYPYQHIEIQLNGYYANPNELILKGRSGYSVNLPTDYDFIGYDGNKWITIKRVRDDELSQNSVHFYSLSTRKFFSSFRVQMQGLTTSNDWHLCIESIEIYGVLTNNAREIVGHHDYSLCSKYHSHIFDLLLCVVLY